jgi:hypothetical protein
MTHVTYEPLDLIAKVAALVPRPHKNLVLYDGVLAANAAWRKRVVAYRDEREREADEVRAQVPLSLGKTLGFTSAPS